MRLPRFLMILLKVTRKMSDGRMYKYFIVMLVIIRGSFKRNKMELAFWFFLLLLLCLLFWRWLLLGLSLRVLEIEFCCKVRVLRRLYRRLVNIGDFNNMNLFCCKEKELIFKIFWFFLSEEILCFISDFLVHYEI